MTSSRSKILILRLSIMILKSFLDQSHHILISCSLRPWLLHKHTRWADLQRKSLLETSWLLSNSHKIWCKEVGLTRMLSIKFQVLKIPNNARKLRLYLVAKPKLSTTMLLSLRHRDRNGHLKYSELIGDLNMINKKNALLHCQSSRSVWLPSLTEKMTL